MHFGLALDSSDIDLWNKDLLDTHIDLLDTGIPSKHFVCLQDVFKTTSLRPTNDCWEGIENFWSGGIEIFWTQKNIEEKLTKITKIFELYQIFTCPKMFWYFQIYTDDMH